MLVYATMRANVLQSNKIQSNTSDHETVKHALKDLNNNDL